MKPVRSSWRWISETLIAPFGDAVVGLVPAWGTFTWNGLRSQFKVLSSRFWGTQPAYDNTIVNFDLARQLYRNDGTESSLGAGFCKPIIDLTVDFIGQPFATTDDEELTDFLNTCLHDYWGSEITQML